MGTGGQIFVGTNMDIAWSVDGFANGVTSSNLLTVQRALRCGGGKALSTPLFRHFRIWGLHSGHCSACDAARSGWRLGRGQPPTDNLVVTVIDKAGHPTDFVACCQRRGLQRSLVCLCLLSGVRVPDAQRPRIQMAKIIRGCMHRRVHVVQRQLPPRPRELRQIGTAIPSLILN